MDRSDGRSSPAPPEFDEYKDYTTIPVKESLSLMSASMDFQAHLVGDVSGRPVFIVDLVCFKLQNITNNF